MDTSTLRREMMRRRDKLDERVPRSATICSQLVSMPAYVVARTIHGYAPMRSEVDTRPLITDALARGKGVIVPVVEPGSFGTFNPRQGRPATSGDWDLTIVPLLAFDRRGYRLGMAGASMTATLLRPTREQLEWPSPCRKCGHSRLRRTMSRSSGSSPIAR